MIKGSNAVDSSDFVHFSVHRFFLKTMLIACSFNVEFTVFSAGCIFPTTFSVEAAFERREAALQHLAHLKARSAARLCAQQGELWLCAPLPPC